MSARGVIFDMDGVLVDSYRAHYESWRRTAAAHGVTVTEAAFAETFGRTNEAIIPLLKPAADAGEIRAWSEEKEAAYRAILAEDFPEMPGASDLVAALAEAGFRLAVGSSGPPENVRAVLERVPAGGRFRAVVTGADIAEGKPHPGVFLKAAEALGVPPAACAVIEDSLAGLEAARRAGMAAVALTGTAPVSDLVDAADRVADALGELSPAALGALIRENAASGNAAEAG
jgi:beta-phosphoglucomutase